MAEVIIMPKLGFDMAEGTLVRWVKAVGQPVEKGEVLAEIETDKATVEVEARAAGVLHTHLVEEGTAVPIGTPIAVIGAADEKIDLEALLASAQAAEVEAPEGATPEAPPTEPLPEAAIREGGDGRLPEGVRATPIARRLAREHGISLASILGSGPGGRIVKRDVEAALAAPAEARPVAITPDLARQTVRQPLSKLRTVIGSRMTASKQQVPHFYVTSEIDAAALMALRSEANALIPEEEKLSVNDFLVKAAALALSQFPNLNATLDDEQIVRHGDINVGIAVGVDEGLLTVVVRNADRKPLRQIASEARAMIARARQGRVRPQDIEGSTFTVSNLGMFDIDHFIAIINPPEAAILAVGSVRQIPVVEGDSIETGMRLKVTLSADHRVTDGVEVARWLQAFRAILEHPLQLVVDWPAFPRERE
ncbi:MAG: dihydrolipoamide acetyltransferase family protein [Anaerolineales bacterium]|jgi:pyruvate dehydrogenase E2 component (dihydrolipoamide acetyltransferase)